MLDKEFPLPLDNDVTRIAVVAVLIGAMFIRFAHSLAAGWLIVAFGLVALWLAHQLAIAPNYDESGGWLGSA